MFLVEGCIVDVPYDLEVQASLIECFKGEDDGILCAWVEPNEADRMEFNDWASNPWIGIKEPKFVCQEEDDSEEKEIHTVYYYNLDSHEELLEEIDNQGIILGFYIINKEKQEMNYKYRLYTYEHNRLSDNEEHRCLFYEGKNLVNFNEKVLPKLQSMCRKYEVE